LGKSLDSREFKLILKQSLFKDLNSGIKKVQEVIDTEVKKLNGTFKSRDSDLKLKYRKTYYLDTSDFRLNSKNFFLRIRGDKKSTKYDVTLKCRHPDRYISSAYDLSHLKMYDTKFEEDIIAPHISKFSISVNFEQDEEPKFDSIEELRSIFPGLISYDLGHGKLLKVNNFEAKEISVKIGKIVYDGKKSNNKDDNKVTLLLNLWYSQKNEVRIRICLQVMILVNIIHNVSCKNLLLPDISKYVPKSNSVSRFYSSFQILTSNGPG
jgi:hypothetical protein